MPKFILIVGPQAVGKMTVGQELAKITNLKLLYNHMTIEILTKIFDYSKETFSKLNINFRTQIFEEFSKTGYFKSIFGISIIPSTSSSVALLNITSFIFINLRILC